MTATTKLRFLLLLIPLSATATTRFVNLSNPTPVAPFTDWGMAATNIQDAIDASVAGDLVLVTNGVYAFGGKVMSGDLTNRVAIDKAVTVQSVNGWMVTVIQGQKDPVSTNGPSAIRCAWLTNGAILSGFTLRYGATRSSGDQYQLRSGGGIWANSTNAVVSNCLLLENAAHFGGGGAYRGWLESCVVKGNVSQTDGGGCYSNVMNRCLALENAARFNGGGSVAGWNYNSAITANSANSGGGVYDGVVLNCTVTFNSAINTGGGIVSGASVFVTNTIVWANSAPSSANYSPVIPFRNSCSTPMPSGTANISADPLLLSDGIHIASNSPCRNVGLSIATGTDLDGQVWNIPPAMGCDEWKPEPVVTTPRFSFDSLGKARVSAMPVGQTPFTFRWMKGGGPLIDGGNLSGTGTTNLVVSPIFPADAGGYQLIVSNSFGAITSQVAQLVVRCVDVNGVSPLPPFANWGNAASNIQDAVDASDSGDLILVTNGIYGRGGKVMSGDLTNRVALDKGVTLMSASGPTATIIQGAWDYATTNGPGAVRGVWMTGNSTLIGFTVRAGAVRGLVGDVLNLQSGGGIWCNSTNARILNCVIVGNSASVGGGVFRGTLGNCLVKDNIASISGSGAGTAYSSLVNSTVTRNAPASPSATAGALGAATNTAVNSIVWGNRYTSPEFTGLRFTNSCTRPLPLGSANITVDPQISADGVHLLATSPCLGTGNSNYISGIDIDGQSWSAPPSMGCDETAVKLALGQPEIVVNGDGRVRLRMTPFGSAPDNHWWFKNGTLVTNDSRITGALTTELSIASFGADDAGFYHAVVSNSLSSVTSTVVRLRPHFVDVNGSNPIQPFTNWLNATTTIQDAVDAADFGDLIVVADGNYNVGGRVISADLTNRVALSKAVILTSLNGPTNTVIQGQMDSNGPNGNGNNSVRAVWMDGWTKLAGFTLRNGSTRTNGDASLLQSGGGVCGLNALCTLAGCIVTNNVANQNGGGACRVQLKDCLILGNTATNGGGVFQVLLDRCWISGNRALSGGGAYGSELRNSVIHRNTAQNVFEGGGSTSCTLYSCTVTENVGRGMGFGNVALNTVSWGNSTFDYGSSSSIHFSCMKYWIYTPGTNNLFLDPQLVDAFHLAETSPCRGTSGQAFIAGTDWEGLVWPNPASRGADEFVASAATGPLSVNIEFATNTVMVNRPLTLIGRVSGHASRIEWSFGDGPMMTDVSYISEHSWTNAGDYTITFTALNASNPTGASASTIIHVIPIDQPTWVSITKNPDPSTFPFYYIELYFNTQVGVTNTFQYATNLVEPVFWMPISTDLATSSPIRLRDLNPTNLARFYRVLSQ